MRGLGATANAHPLAAALATSGVAAILGAVAAVGTASLPAFGYVVLGIVLSIGALHRLGPSRLASASMLGAAFVAPLRGLGPTGVEPADVCLLLVFMSLLLGGPELPRSTFRALRPLLGGLLLVCAGGLVGYALAPDPGSTALAQAAAGSSIGPIAAPLADVLRFGVGTVGVILLASWWNPTSRLRRLALAAFLAGSAVSASHALLFERGSDRALGLSDHPVPFGLNCALGVMLAFGFILDDRGWRRLALPAGGLCAYGLLASGTRSALVVVAVAVLLYQVTLRRAMTVFIPVLACLLLVLVAVLVPGIGESPTISRLGSDSSTTSSDGVRDQLRADATAFVQQHGVTGGGFGYLHSPHNLLLAVLAAAGLLGFAGLVSIVAAFVLRLLRGETDVVSSAAIACVLAMFLGFYVVNVGWARWLWIPIALAVAPSAGIAPRLSEPRSLEVSS